MKSIIQKFSLLMFVLFFSMIMNAQETVTVDNTSGNLKNNLAENDLGSIISLTIKGTMDARDFKFMRDEMPVLADIDMSSTTVTYYNGAEGTTAGVYLSAEYPADKVPPFAFSTPKTYIGKSTLVSVKLPRVRAVLYNAFWGCSNLQTVVFPPTVTTIGERAFYDCTSLVNMELPPFIGYIESLAFGNCTSLTSITWPSTLRSASFANCTGLRSIHIVSHTPQDFLLPNYNGDYIKYLFELVDKELCILYVPYGTKVLYEAAEGWKDFKNIVEDSKGFRLSVDSLQFSSLGGSDNSIRISANTQWSAVSDQTWLTVSPSSGNSDAVLTITAEENKQDNPRRAILTFTAQGSTEHQITIYQQSNHDILDVTPGNLSTLLGEQKSSITSLTLSGQIDARDFKTMRDEMPQLVNIDLRRATIVEYTGSGGTLGSEFGPETYYGNNVIPFLAFAHGDAGSSTLRSVQIPLNTITLGESAFLGCKGLTSFTIPSSVIFINEMSFYGCSGLKSIDLPPSVVFVARQAFSGCTSLTTVELSPAITVIWDYLFYNCTSLISVQIPSGVTEIKRNAFYGCTSLATVNIPNGVSAIGESAFEGCSALASVSLPESLTFIGESAFSDCSSLTGPLILPTKIPNIEKYTFYRCHKLTSVEFSIGLDSIKASAFDSCMALSGNLTLPSTLRYIGERAFANCRSFNGTLTLPLHLTTIESFAFVDCRSISSIVVRNPYPVSLCSAYAVFEGVDRSIPLQVPFGSKELYSSAEVWKEFTNITEESQGMLLTATTASFGPEGGTNSSITLKASVAWTASSDQSWLTVSPASGNSTQVLTLTAQANPDLSSRTGTITLSASGVETQRLQVTQSSVPFVVHTTSGNFRSLFTDEQYNSITRLVITGTMSRPEIGALKAMPMLSEVDMSGVTITPYHAYIAKYDFYYPANSFPGYEGGYTMNYSLQDDTTLTSIVLPSNLERIEINAFKGCSNLTSVVFPSTLTYIGVNAFMNCKSLTTVKLPPLEVQLDYGVFSGCTGLSSVELSEGITGLSGTFEGCTSLTNVKLPSTLKIIGYNVFKGCNKLTQLEIPSMVTDIGESSFYGCTSLTSVVLPASVTTIHRDAFAECTTMSVVNLPRSLTTIRDGAFRECRGLTSVYCYAAEPPKPDADSQGVFFLNVDINRCILYVPYGSRHLYQQAVQWKEFKNIVEMEQFNLPVTSISMEADQGSVTVAVTAGTEWTATSNESWLTILPASGNGSADVIFSAEANTTVTPRYAIVTFNVNDLQLQDLIVVQKGIPATIDLTPGSLSSRYSIAEMMGMTRLVITGTMDARDFKTIKERMPSLTELDMSAATIAAYTGFEGTIASDLYQTEQANADGYTYPANGIPPEAFFNGKTKLLSTILLPPSLSSIGAYAFSALNQLDSLPIPASVTSIGFSAFSACTSLTSVVLPPDLIHIPGSLFSGSGLRTVSIPSTVTSIGYGAFGNCTNLTILYSYAPNPPEIDYSYYQQPSILGIDKTNITLYVPYGSKEAYAAAPNEWKEFTKVVEMPGFRLSAVTVAVKAAQGSEAKAGIQSDVQWTATTDQSWLTISPISGTGADTLTFSAQANTMDAGRMATVTISAPDVVAQTITVIQEGKLKTITLTPGNIASVLTSEEMSGITHLTITGVMDARDFRVMRDQMPLLTYLDLSQVKIAEFQEINESTGKLFTNRISTIPDNAFFDQKNKKGKTSLTTVIFPNTLEKIGFRAFSKAAGLTLLRFPFTMKYIELDAFNACPYLTSIYSYALAPPATHKWGISFYNVDKDNCILYVPLSSKALYAKAEMWKEFNNIVEMAEFKIMTSKAILKATTDNVRMRIQSQVPWTAEPLEVWLTVNPASGNDNQVIIITAEANPLEMLRTGTVIFKAEGYLPQVFTVSQLGIPKTINLTAGNLASLLTPDELQEITNLVITGTMDARDFKVIRDRMPWLVRLDITGVTISAYSGVDGTSYSNYDYKQNAIPPIALYNSDNNFKSRLSTVLLPSSITLIDGWAFSQATALTSLIIPPSVTTIKEFAFYGTRSLQTVEISEGVDSIYKNAFSSCQVLSSISIPSSVKYIGVEAFGNLSQLRSINSYAIVPLQLSNASNVFWQADKDSCILYVPYGSRALYAAADQWKDFTHIVEMGGFNLSATELTIEAVPAIQTIQVTTERAWSAVSDKEWLTVSPLTGEGGQIITFKADTNHTAMGRTAIVTITADTLSQTVMVFQKGVPKTINMTAGNLSSVLTTDELLQTTKLILTGEIDARDFKTMRDKMPNLEVLDMSGATIVRYQGNEGTIKNLFTTYPPNKIPPEAFYNAYTNVKPKLSTIQLPVSAESIGYDAFNSCYLLTEVKMFNSLTFIDERAFKDCSSLTFLNLLTAYTIGKDAFNGCKSLATVKLPFGYTYLGEGAFLGCSALHSLYSYMNEAPYLNNFINVFDGIDQRTCTLYVAAGSKEKYEMADHWKDFEHIVEMGEPIVSPKEIVLDANVGSSATITISGIGLWTFGWDQSWLELDGGYGLDDQTITVTIDEANTTTEDRICIVTIAPIGLDWQSVVVTQKGIAAGDAAIISLDSQIAGGTEEGIATEVVDIDQNKPLVNCYPNPFTTKMSIDIANPSLEEVSVEIYCISGQKIKTLARALKGENISLDWNGEDEQGRKVVPGMYLLKVNEEVKRVVRR